MSEEEPEKKKKPRLRGWVGKRAGPEADDQEAEDEITAALKKKDKK